MWFGTICVVLCKSRNVDIVQNAAGFFNTGGIDNGGVCRNKGYLYSSSCDLIYIMCCVG